MFIHLVFVSLHLLHLILQSIFGLHLFPGDRGPDPCIFLERCVRWIPNFQVLVALLVNHVESLISLATSPLRVHSTQLSKVGFGTTTTLTGTTKQNPILEKEPCEGRERASDPILHREAATRNPTTQSIHAPQLFCLPCAFLTSTMLPKIITDRRIVWRINFRLQIQIPRF